MQGEEKRKPRKAKANQPDEGVDDDEVGNSRATHLPKLRGLAGLSGGFLGGGVGGGGAILWQGIRTGINRVHEIPIEGVAQEKLNEALAGFFGVFEGAIELIVGLGVVERVFGLLKVLLETFGLVFIGGRGELAKAIQGFLQTLFLIFEELDNGVAVVYDAL